jgi:hypothetical protein
MMRRGMTADQVRLRAAMRQGAPERPAPKKAAPQNQATEDSEYKLLLQSRERLDALEDAKLRRQKALAERQEIENMLRRGELLPVSYVRKWASRLLVEAKDELLRIPSELADTLAAETDAIKVAFILRAAQERAIAKLQQLDRIWRRSGDEMTVA